MRSRRRNIFFYNEQMCTLELIENRTIEVSAREIPELVKIFIERRENYE